MMDRLNTVQTYDEIDESTSGILNSVSDELPPRETLKRHFKRCHRNVEVKK